MRVHVGEVDLEATKQTKGGAIYRAKCSWTDYKEQWTSLYFQPQPDSDYDAKIVSREWNGKILWTVKEGALIGAPTPQATPANGTGTGQTRQAPLPIRAELRAIGQIVKTLKQECGEMDPRTLDTILIEEFKRQAVARMVEYQSKELDEEGPWGGASSSGEGELPRDEEINY